MAERSAAENNALAILRVFADNNIGVGQVLMLDWLKTLYTRSIQHSSGTVLLAGGHLADFDEGLAYALEHGWVKEHVSEITMQEAGQKQLATT